MSEPNIEEIVAEIETRLSHGRYSSRATGDELVRLIASWRARGEALEKARDQYVAAAGCSTDWHRDDLLAEIDAALKDKP